MPIFQDDFGNGRTTPPGEPPISPALHPRLERHHFLRRLSDESIRTELCEGPISESPDIPHAGFPKSEANNGTVTSHETSDRGELIERLKRGVSPTWVSNRKLESFLHDYSKPITHSSTTPFGTPPLLPSPEISEAHRLKDEEKDRNQVGLEIERPRSALHSGDFTESRGTSHNENRLLDGPLDFRSKEAQWLSTSPPRSFALFHSESQFSSPEGPNTYSHRRRAPSVSSSLSSSFVLKPPTSPLVQSQSNEDFDLSSQLNPIDINPEVQRNPRRHTLHTAHSSYSALSDQSVTNFSRPLPHLRRDNTFPYQAHQPRRSLTSHSISQPTSSPQTPLSRSRRPSFSEGSPLHASMVGSYEESILRGRMSTTPSKPLDFVAQIGVLGLGKCKPSLKCPPHVTVPFPAVFYSYETTSYGRPSKADDEPSPYVGQIDLEGSLPHPEESREIKRRRHATNTGKQTLEDLDNLEGQTPSHLTEHGLRKAEKQKRRSTSPRAPPGGSYRIPEKGQLQIIIKNPNKTAVKLYLVPYDLSGMEPGTKTFIRQRSYSAGPIIATSTSTTGPTIPANPSDRPTLRYLIHLHICSPSRGRFYLYKSIRVVFANRVPDGKEKLRNEISLPEPRFSVYKPGRDSGFGTSNSVGMSLAAEKAYRRRSSGFPLGHSVRAFDNMDGIAQAIERGFGGSPGFPNERSFSALPIQPIPFNFAPKRGATTEGIGLDKSADLHSSTSSQSSRPATSQDSESIISWGGNNVDFNNYDKLSKGDLGYGGNMFTTSPDGKQAMEGLLAKRLKDLGVKNAKDGMESSQ